MVFTGLARRGEQARSGVGAVILAVVGEKYRCARICGLSRRSISTKLAEYQIDKGRYKLPG